MLALVPLSPPIPLPPWPVHSLQQAGADKRRHTMVWETIVNLVCRPPRYTYDPDDVLGPKRFRIDGRLFERIDVEVGAPSLIPLTFLCK
jgi:hypothetical protein